MMDPTVGREDEADVEESEAQGKSHEAYDKSILTLSGGALGLSFITIKDYLSLRGGAGAGLIVLALLCWALSVSCTLFCSVSPRKALRSTTEREDARTTSARSRERSARRARGLRISSGVLFSGGVVFFAAYVAGWPTVGGRQPPVSAARQEIARVLSLYDTIRETCPDCSVAEVRNVLQVCEGSYIVPDVLRQACPRCTEKGIVELNLRCMEKWK